MTATATAAIEALLRRTPLRHVYELGDLDPRETPHTTWYCDEAAGAVALLYRGLAVPTLLAFGEGDGLRALLARHAGELPARFYAHLTPGLEGALAAGFVGERLGTSVKMGLAALRADAGAGEPVVVLGPRDAEPVARFYRAHYPGSYFEPGSLERGPYLALEDADGVVAIAGVHVYSPALRVAAIGNVATRGDARGRGYARRITAALCRRLRAGGIETIGLNVHADNAPAIACYRGLGFEPVGALAEFGEWRFARA